MSDFVMELEEDLFVDLEDPDLDLDDDQLQYESLDILPANTTNIPSTSKQLRSKNKNAIDDAIRRSIEKAYEKKQVAGKKQVVEKEARMERCRVIAHACMTKIKAALTTTREHEWPPAVPPTLPSASPCFSLDEEGNLQADRPFESSFRQMFCDDKVLLEQLVAVSLESSSNGMIQAFENLPRSGVLDLRLVVSDALEARGLARPGIYLRYNCLPRRSADLGDCCLYVGSSGNIGIRTRGHDRAVVNQLFNAKVEELNLQPSDWIAKAITTYPPTTHLPPVWTDWEAILIALFKTTERRPQQIQVNIIDRRTYGLPGIGQLVKTKGGIIIAGVMADDVLFKFWDDVVTHAKRLAAEKFQHGRPPPRLPPFLALGCIHDYEQAAIGPHESTMARWNEILGPRCAVEHNVSVNLVLLNLFGNGSCIFGTTVVEFADRPTLRSYILRHPLPIIIKTDHPSGLLIDNSLDLQVAMETYNILR